MTSTITQQQRVEDDDDEDDADSDEGADSSDGNGVDDDDIPGSVLNELIKFLKALFPIIRAWSQLWSP